MVAPHLRNPRQCCIFPIFNGQGLCAWKVEVVRGGTRLGGVFSVAEYGGEAAARSMAESYRNALVLKRPPSLSYEERQRLMPHNTSGHPGVIRVETNNTGYWRASTRIHGYSLSRSFSVRRHGEEQAKRLALHERERQLALCGKPYEQAMEALQHYFGQSNSRAREHRIRAAMARPREVRASADALAPAPHEPTLSISPEQAFLSISRHFAASTK
ncbi:AP2 domain-containing protein [Pseudomonas sp. FEN]|uniref:AP2 domain-containing protein n=1 Tax=Pseudomonas sp. FEN TaxID=2767468 RepID=UPI001749B6F3|nr:AP2 domain-containing protein [Pseudomonas sp. FEN]